MNDMLLKLLREKIGEPYATVACLAIEEQFGLTEKTRVRVIVVDRTSVHYLIPDSPVVYADELASPPEGTKVTPFEKFQLRAPSCVVVFRCAHDKQMDIFGIDGNSIRLIPNPIGDIP